jgi:hypothetical protein
VKDENGFILRHESCPITLEFLRWLSIFQIGVYNMLLQFSPGDFLTDDDEEENTVEPTVAEYVRLAVAVIERSTKLKSLHIMGYDTLLPALQAANLDNLGTVEDFSVAPAIRFDATAPYYNVDDIVEYLVPRITHVRTVDLSHCRIISYSFIDLSTHCKDITHLKLHCNEFIEDKDLGKLAESCVLLEEIDLSYCGEDITIVGVKHLVRKCSFLKVLYLSRCTNITEENKKALPKNVL